MSSLGNGTLIVIMKNNDNGQKLVSTSIDWHSESHDLRSTTAHQADFLN